MMMSADMEFEGGPDSPGGAWDMTSDPNGVLAASPPLDRYEARPELAHDVHYCRAPRHRRPRKYRCQECFGWVHVRPAAELDLERVAPGPTRLGVFTGYWLRAWKDALNVLRVRPPAPEPADRWFIAAGQIAHWTVDDE